MHLKKRVFLFSFLVWAAHAHAQIDSLQYLKPIEISADARILQFNKGLKKEKTDSTIFAQSQGFSLADLLQRISPVYIKSYGGSSLASTSFRGGSANHTAILWNGFNLQSPVNGMIDLSLLPIQLFNEVAIQYGGQSSAWGSGAVGGTIQLQSSAKFNAGTAAKVYVGAGSFNEQRYAAQASYSNSKFVNETKFMRFSNDNNFDYRYMRNDSLLSKKLSNASALQSAVMQENYFKISSKQMLETHIWLQKSEREIPPTLGEQYSQATQEDQSARFTAAYHYYFNKAKLSVRSAYFNEYLDFKQDELSTNNISKSGTFINEITLSKTQKQISFFGGLNQTYAQVKSIEYSSNKPTQLKTAAFVSAQALSKNEKLMASATLRQEVLGNQIQPITWSFGVEYQLVKQLKLKANASKVYRVPTLNDLYWAQGGNPNLLSENGYAYEASTVFEPLSKQSNHSLSIELNAFSRVLNNWIIWLPQGSYYTAQNLMQVWSRGAETSTHYKYNYKHGAVFCSLNTSYVLSENLQSKTNDDASIHKQLIYIPLYSGQFNCGASYKSISILFNQTYTGYRYTSNDHTNYLTPYYLSNCSFSYKTHIKKQEVNFQFQINNLLNANYQVLAARPMPGINYRGGIVLNLHSNYGKL